MQKSASIDAEIILEICQAIDKLGATELSDLISQYGELKNEDLIELLQGWNVNRVCSNNQPNDPNAPPIVNFITLEGTDFRAAIVKTIKKLQYYSEKKQSMVYSFFINDKLYQFAEHENLKFEYLSEIKRDKMYMKLKNSLVEHGYNFIEL